MEKHHGETTIVEAEAVCCGIPMDTSYTSCNCSSGDASGARAGLARHQDDKVGDVEAVLRATCDQQTSEISEMSIEESKSSRQIATNTSFFSRNFTPFCILHILGFPDSPRLFSPAPEETTRTSVRSTLLHFCWNLGP